ncbi:hypothetical protein IJG78_03450 [Candidatus Saccharibacteria bacterium]|nr:hypothetical protein [Candidatus Saccharibacteria bacterium]MBQ3309706.1 hypothetical protein [Candidatus Saccharibacteria bacterium]
MSKTTKIIAALGVVAGLGVAALPAFTYATASVSGQVEVRVDVDPAIAMTISGNNDWDGSGTQPAGTQAGVSVYNGASEIGSYNATNTTPTGVDATGTGYTIQTSGSKTNILPNALVEGVITGTGANGFGSTITVYTNDSGYSLTVQDANNDNSLTSGSNTIPAVGTTTPTANTLAPGSAAWGFKGGLITSWTAVPVNDGGTTQPATIKNGSGATLMTGDETEVLYAVSTAAAQPVGTYTDTIVYTATTAN